MSLRITSTASSTWTDIRGHFNSFQNCIKILISVVAIDLKQFLFVNKFGKIYAHFVMQLCKVISFDFGQP